MRCVQTNMVDPFQVLDNGNTLSASNENHQILLRLKQNMNDESTNFRICNEPTDHATNDEEKKNTNFDLPDGTANNDGDDDDDDNDRREQKSGPDNLDHLLKMGVPLNHHQSYEVNHMPYNSQKSCNKRIEQNNCEEVEEEESFVDNVDTNKQGEYCVSDNCESESGVLLDADADFRMTNPIIRAPMDCNEQLTKHFELSVCSSSSSCSSSLNLSDTDPTTIQYNQQTTTTDNCNSVVVNSSNLPTNCGVNTNSNEEESVVVVAADMETINNYDSPTSTTTDGPPMEVMDNRRVEPLKINLNREPIKTIIKIPKHVVAAETKTTTTTVPKITIKVPQHHHHTTGDDDDDEEDAVVVVPKHKLIVDSSVSTSSSSSSSSSSSQNCMSDPPSETHVIPKLTIRNSTNSFGIAGQSEIVPKLTIKMDNHIGTTTTTQANNKDKTINHSDDKIKLTIKPILEPPIPKLTIKTSKTNSNDCVEVLNSNATKFSINVSGSGPSSPSSSTTAMNKLNRIVTHPAPSKSESTVPKIKIKQITKTDDPLGEVPQFTIAKSDDMVFVANSKDNVLKTVPKLVVKLPPKENDNEQNKSETYDDSETTATPPQPVDEVVPKITIRQIKQSEQNTTENIIIPKVTIRPIINPNNEADDTTETLITPKITIKPIPKPLDITQPLEIVTTPPTTAIKLTESSMNESQQSPRIILKINKTTSETISKSVVEDSGCCVTSTNQKDLLPSNNSISKKTTQFPMTVVSSVVAENDLKRTNSIIHTPVDNKRLKLDPSCVNSVVVVAPVINDEIINLDSDDDIVTEPIHRPSPSTESNNRHDKVEKLAQIPHVQAMVEINDTVVTEQSQGIGTPTIVRTMSLTETLIPVTTSTTTSSTMPQKINSNSSAETIKPKLPFPGNFFLGEDVRPEIPHPLLTHTIERAKLLVSMMNADAEASPKEEQAKNNKRSQNVIVLSEGSSSDCIMLGDNGTSLPNSIDFGVTNLNENGQNNADRDSGVDVSNSIKSGADDIIEDITPIKRGRGRPRKDVVTPAVVR